MFVCVCVSVFYIIRVVYKKINRSNLIKDRVVRRPGEIDRSGLVRGDPETRREIERERDFV